MFQSAIIKMEIIEETVKVEDEFSRGLDKENPTTAKEFLLDSPTTESPYPGQLDINHMIVEATGPYSFASGEFLLLQDFSIDEILRLKKSLTLVAVQLRSSDPARNKQVTHTALYNVGVLLSALYNLADENRLR